MCAPRSRSVLLRQVFPRFSIYSLTKPFTPAVSFARARASERPSVRPTDRPGKFPSGFLARKVKGTAPNPSCTRPHERLFRMRVLAAYVYTAAEFQPAVGQGIHTEERKGSERETGLAGEGGLPRRVVFARVYIRERWPLVVVTAIALLARTSPCRRRNTSPHRTNL